MKNKIFVAAILLLAFINIFLFWPRSLYFLNDDLVHIPLTDNGYLFQTNSVRPVHELLVRLDLFLYGKNAYGYHITALLLHFIVCAQVYELCLVIQKKLLNIEKQQAITGALLSVVLFLLYPQSSESLAWIIGRTPVLAAVFFMITVRLFFVENYRWTTYVIGAFFFAMSLFTYEQTLFLPLALLYLASILKKEKRSRHFRYAFILIFVTAGYLVVRKLITSEIVGRYEGGNLLLMNWLNLGANAFRLLFRLVLNPAYKVHFVFCSIALVLLTVLVFLKTRKMSLNQKCIIFFTQMVLLLIAPVISLGLAVNSFESGRYLYLPSIFFIIGISIASVAVFTQLPGLRKPLIVLLIAVTGYWLWGKYTASQHYKDASSYAEFMQNKIQQHFKTSSDTLYIDTLHVTVQRLPVFRLGFKTGIKWFNSNIDTNKIVVRYFYDEVTHRSL